MFTHCSSRHKGQCYFWGDNGVNLLLGVCKSHVVLQGLPACLYITVLPKVTLLVCLNHVCDGANIFFLHALLFDLSSMFTFQ